MGATIYNSDLSRTLLDVAKIQTSKDSIPSEISEKVVAVIDVNPNHNRLTNLLKATLITNATAGTIYTIPSDRDTYITGCQLAYIKDATSTSTSCNVTLNLAGANISILFFPLLTLTAGENTATITFPNPIKVDKGTTIDVNCATATGNISVVGCISGYQVLNINA